VGLVWFVQFFPGSVFVLPVDHGESLLDATEITVSCDSQSRQFSSVQFKARQVAAKDIQCYCKAIISHSVSHSVNHSVSQFVSDLGRPTNQQR